MIAVGLGVSIIPQSLPLLPALKSVRLLAPEVTRTISLTTVKSRTQAKTAQVLCKLAVKRPWPEPTALAGR